MRGSYKVVYGAMANNANIASELDAAPNGVRKGRRPENGTFTTCVRYRAQGATEPPGTVGTGRYAIPFGISVFCKEGQGDDAEDRCWRIAWKIVHRFQAHGKKVPDCNLNDACPSEPREIFVYDARFDGFQSPPDYDTALECWWASIRITLICSECSYSDPAPDGCV